MLSRRELVKSTVALLPLLVSLHPSKSHSATVESLPNLRRYVDEADNYELSYPAEWEQDRLVELHSPKSRSASSGKTSVAFHNVMDPFENVSVVVSPLGNNGPPSLRSLGDPDRLASGLLRNVIANPNTSDRTAQLVWASSWQDDGGVEYYLFEFRVQSERWRRHNIASLTIANNKLYTLTVQIPESRWDVLESDARAVAHSFHIRS